MPGPAPAKGIPISRVHPQPHTQSRSPGELGPVLLISMPISIPSGLRGAGMKHVLNQYLMDECVCVCGGVWH